MWDSGMAWCVPQERTTVHFTYMPAKPEWIPSPFGEPVAAAKDDLSSVSYDDAAETLFEGDFPDLPKEIRDEDNETATIFTLGVTEQQMEQDFMHHYWIRKKGTFTPTPWGPLLKSNPAQKRFLRFLINVMRTPGPKRVAVLKGRQSGTSTTVIAFLMHILQVLRWNGMIVTHSESSSLELMRSAREMWERMPPHRRKPLRYNLKNALVWGQSRKSERDRGNLGHEASLVARTAKGNYIASGSSISAAHLSEAAKYDTVGDLEDQMVFILSILQAVPKVGPSLGIAEFTANGAIGWAYETFTAAVRRTAAAHDDMRWIPYFISWLEDPSTRRPVPPGYKWADWPKEDFEKEKMILSYGATLENLFYRRVVVSTEMNMDFDSFDQEYPSNPGLAFLTSGRSVFSRKLLLPQWMQACDPVERLSITSVDSDTAQTETQWGEVDAPPSGE